jgi:HAE1 family hydrophobic/amphiphilic exporter-1
MPPLYEQLHLMSPPGSAGGTLTLMGMVVNNGIVLVYRINQLLNSGYAVQKAIIEACLTRVGPILMTVAPTAWGLLPLALGTTRIGGDGPPYLPIAIIKTQA